MRGLVDSHCHLPMLGEAGASGDLATTLAEAAAEDVHHFLCVAVDLAGAAEVIGLAETDARIHAAIGVHPNEAPGEALDVPTLEALAAHPRVVAVGETGLDYFRSSGDLGWQQERFRLHIDVARRLRKPLVIHSREARADTLAILAEENAREVGGVMHCFVEDFDTAIRAIDLGFLISFSGIVTFRNAHALQDVARRLPLDRLLVETDCPYLAPVPHRGKPNRPAWVRHVADFLAELRGEDREAFAAATTANFFALFRGATPASLAA